MRPSTFLKTMQLIFTLGKSINWHPNPFLQLIRFLIFIGTVFVNGTINQLNIHRNVYAWLFFFLHDFIAISWRKESHLADHCSLIYKPILIVGIGQFWNWCALTKLLRSVRVFFGSTNLFFETKRFLSDKTSVSLCQIVRNSVRF